MIRMPEQKQRLNSALKAVFSGLALQAAEALPASGGQGVGSDAYNLVRNTAVEYCRTTMHQEGRNALDNPLAQLPHSPKIFQNLWPVFHFPGGLTEVDALYTYRTAMGETPIYLQRKGETMTPQMLEQLKGLGASSVGQESQMARSVLSGIPEKRSFTMSGGYEELTRGDTKATGLPDPTQFKPDYMLQELWLIAEKGSRQMVASVHDPQGQRSGQVIRYARPGPHTIATWLLTQDAVYAAADYAFKPFEMGGIGGQSMYKGVIDISKRGSRDFWSSGGYNPIGQYLQ